MSRRIRITTEKLAVRLEDEIPEVICTPKEDEYQVTVTLLKKNGITFDLLTARMQQHISGGYLEQNEYDELVRTLKDLL